MPLHLRVHSPFGDYARGATIDDAETIAELHANGQAAQHCVPFDGDAEHLKEVVAAEQAEVAKLETDIAHHETQE